MQHLILRIQAQKARFCLTYSSKKSKQFLTVTSIKSMISIQFIQVHKVQNAETIH